MQRSAHAEVKLADSETTACGLTSESINPGGAGIRANRPGRTAKKKRRRRRISGEGERPKLARITLQCQSGAIFLAHSQIG
jgi:hypothetical protein